jgi:protein-disulfide isomerase
MANNERSREKRREERLAEESKAASGDRRTRLLQFAAGGVFLAIIIVVVVIVAVGGGSSSGGDASNLVEKPEVEKLLSGSSQYGTTIGKKSAPVKLYEYGDLQCPICKEYSEEILPEIIENQVKKGEASITFRNFIIIGPQSIPAGEAALAAGAQDKGWSFIETWYRNQGEENSGYVTDDFLTKVLTGAGADAAKAIAGAGSSAVSQEIAAAKTLSDRYGVTGTPTILVGPTGGQLKTDGEGQPTAAGVGKLVDAALAAKGGQ